MPAPMRPLPDQTWPRGLVAAAWQLLRGWRSPLPGSPDQSPPRSDQIQTWVATAKQTLMDSGRGRVASEVIGEALSGPGTDPDGVWPSRAVRDVLEHERDDEMERGLVACHAALTG